MTKKKHLHFNEVPKFLTTDISGGCHVYECTSVIRSMRTMECLFRCVKVIRYDGIDALVEEPTGHNEESIILELRTGSLLPETSGDLELTWYEHESDSSKEITLDDIITMCAI